MGKLVSKYVYTETGELFDMFEYYSRYALNGVKGAGLWIQFQILVFKIKGSVP